MSALVTHVLIGGLVGLALRWDRRWAPRGMLLARLPDLHRLGAFEMHGPA